MEDVDGEDMTRLYIELTFRSLMWVVGFYIMSCLITNHCWVRLFDPIWRGSLWLGCLSFDAPLRRRSSEDLP